MIRRLIAAAALAALASSAWAATTTVAITSTGQTTWIVPLNYGTPATFQAIGCGANGAAGLAATRGGGGGGGGA